MRKKYLLPALMFLMVAMGCGGGGDITSVLSSTKAITAFSLDGVSGTIDETGKTISVFMPKDTDVTALVATFTTTGSSVKVGSALQVSGTTANDFTDPVDYTVTAADGTTQAYTVTVTVSTSNSGFPDTSFGTNGVVKTSIGSGNDYATAMEIQSDGKIVVAGYSHNGSKYVFALVRYNVDGSVDEDFGSDGKVTTAIGSSDAAAYALAIQSDLKIVVAGVSSNGSNNDFTVARYNTNGTPDTSFGTGGVVTTAIGSADDVANTLGIQADGKIVVAGYSRSGSNNVFAVVRYESNGSPDESFGTNGIVTTAIGASYDVAYTLGIQSDGKIVVAGVTYKDIINDSNNDFAVVRYESNGTLDTGFGTGGIVTTAIGSEDDIAYALAIQSDGKILVAGTSNNGSNNDFAIVKYTTTGSLDTTFGPNHNGKVTTPVGDNFAAASALVVQSDKKIMVAGISYDAFNSDFALVRYKEDGSLDTGFYAGGIVTTSIGSGLDVVGAVRLQSGKIVVAGYTYNGSNYDFALIRYWP